MVGKVITVQLFDREPNDPDTIIPSSLKKFVGKLQGYQIEPTRWAFALEGIPPVQVKNGRYAEIFPIELSVPKPH